MPINCYKDKYFSCPGNSSLHDFVENPECSLLNNMALSADNNMILYFRNLLEFSPMNSGYSCGYVSLIVDSDIWSYKNGTLIFHNADEETI